MDKLKDIKPGDRVRVTFEGVMQPDYYFIPDGCEGKGGWAIIEDEASAPTFHIERMEKPLEVGERVRSTRKDDLWSGRLVAVDGPDAVVRSDNGSLVIWLLSYLERIA